MRYFCSFLRRGVLALATLALLVCLVPGRTHADTVTIIPPRFELFGNPGDTIVEKMRVRNSSDTQITYSTIIEDFKANGDEGGVDLLENTTNGTYSLKKWITVEPSQFTIAAGDEKTLDVAIRIPKDGEPGGHFASVLVQRGGTPTNGGAAVESRVGSLILLRVSGDIKESAHVDTFKAEESFAQHGPTTFDLRTINDGNVHVAPRGTIVITNMFGKKVAELPLTTANVLPGAARIARTTWDQKNLIGRYTATLVAQYGESTSGSQVKTLSATTTFIVFPLYLLWITLGVIILIILLITQRKRVRKFINRLTSD